MSEHKQSNHAGNFKCNFSNSLTNTQTGDVYNDALCWTAKHTLLLFSVFGYIKDTRFMVLIRITHQFTFFFTFTFYQLYVV